MGGCYAKTIHLSWEKKRQIYEAVRFGTALENVGMDRRTREVDYSDAPITENTRAAYPLEHIAGAVLAGHAWCAKRLASEFRISRLRGSVRGGKTATEKTFTQPYMHNAYNKDAV